MKIYLSSSSESSVDIQLNRATHVFLNERWYHNHTKTPFSRLYIIKDGTGVLKTDKGEIPLVPGSMYFIPAEYVVGYSCTYLEKIFLHFSVIGFEKYDIFSKLDQVYVLPYAQKDYDTLLECLKPHSYYDYLKLEATLLSQIVRFTEECALPAQKAKHYSVLTTRIIDFIQENVSIKLRIEDLSKVLFVSESKIRKVFREEMGMPIGKYMDDMVFEKAKLLLAEKELPLSYISAQLGFCDQFYFARRFKEKVGPTPSDFRRWMK